MSTRDMNDTMEEGEILDSLETTQRKEVYSNTLTLASDKDNQLPSKRDSSRSKCLSLDTDAIEIVSDGIKSNKSHKSRTISKSHRLRDGSDDLNHVKHASLSKIEAFKKCIALSERSRDSFRKSHSYTVDYPSRKRSLSQEKENSKRSDRSDDGYSNCSRRHRSRRKRKNSRHSDNDDDDNGYGGREKHRKKRQTSDDERCRRRRAGRSHDRHLQRAKPAPALSFWPASRPDDSHLTDNVLMRKLLQLGSMNKASSNSDLNCEVGSISTISSPDYSCFDHNIITATGHMSPSGSDQNNDARAAAAAASSTTTTAAANIDVSDDSEIEVIIPYKPPPILIDLKSDSDCEQEAGDNGGRDDNVIQKSVTIVQQSPAKDPAASSSQNQVTNEKHSSENVSVNKCNNEPAAEDDLDDLELRLAALRSAVLKKHQQRLKRKGKPAKDLCEREASISIESEKNHDVIENRNEEDCELSHNDVYHPSNQTSPMSPTSSYNFSPTHECNTEQDMDLSMSDKEMEDAVVAESQHFGYQLYDSGSGAGCPPVSWPSQHPVLPPQPLPPGVDVSNLPPEFSHSVFSCPPPPPPPPPSVPHQQPPPPPPPPPRVEHPTNSYFDQSQYFPPANYAHFVDHPPPPPPTLLVSSGVGDGVHPSFMSNDLANPCCETVVSSFVTDQSQSLLAQTNFASHLEPCPNEFSRQLEPCVPGESVDIVPNNSRKLMPFMNNSNLNNNVTVRLLEPCTTVDTKQASVDRQLEPCLIVEENNFETKKADGNRTELHSPCSRTVCAADDVSVSRGIENCVDRVRLSPDHDDYEDESEEILRQRALTSLSKRNALKSSNAAKDQSQLTKNLSADTETLNASNVKDGLELLSKNTEHDLSNRVSEVNMVIENPIDSCVLSTNKSRSIIDDSSLNQTEELNEVVSSVKQSSATRLTEFVEHISNSVTSLSEQYNNAEPPINEYHMRSIYKNAKQANLRKRNSSKAPKRDRGFQRNKIVSKSVVRLKNTDPLVRKFPGTNSQATCSQMDRRKTIEESSSIKADTFQVGKNAEQAKKFIIRLGQDSDDSNGEDLDNREGDCRKVFLVDDVDGMSNESVESKHRGLEKQIDKLLREVRQLHEMPSSHSANNRPTNVSNSSPKNVAQKSPVTTRTLAPLQQKIHDSLKPTDLSTPPAVKHLPKSAQEEYRRLKQAMAAKEKKLQAARSQLQLKKKQSLTAECSVLSPHSAGVPSPIDNVASPAASVAAVNEPIPQAEADDSCSNPAALTSNDDDGVSAAAATAATTAMLSEAEDKLLLERYMTLDKLVELEAEVSRVELRMEHAAAAESEVMRLRLLLATEEKKLLRAQTSLAESLDNMRVCADQSERHLCLCADFERSCVQLGGADYKLPTAGSDLLKAKSQSVFRKREMVLGKQQPQEERTVKLGDDGKMEVIVNRTDNCVAAIARDDNREEVPLPLPIPPSLQESAKQVTILSSVKSLPDYVSPLNHLQSNLNSSRSSTLTAKVDCNESIFCPYDLMGSCRDEACPYQH